ncbi:denticleless protein homolog [Bombina bombina]|uniref:denticleless protein homolog n=1 Tax=Bombina bombina TaxID=8345 RepID=UPI00235A9339|nr:denticleless protein homolog [Bombina bombina]
MLFRSIINKPLLGARKNGSPYAYPLQPLLKGFQCVKEDEHISYGEMGMPVPPFGCSFSKASDMDHVLVVANEEGMVRMYDTESRDLQRQIVKEWMAHSNAVFDVAWVPGEHKLVTASGDQTAKLWDVKAGELIGVFKGHQCSVKSVAFPKYEKAVFSTGGRDGNIMLWDTRCSKKDGAYRQVNQISGAHNALDKQTPSKIKKRKPAARGLAPSVDSQQSVTVVVFRDEHTLISAGAVDGIVKMWDLRKNYTSYRQDPVPAKTFPYAGNSTRKLGYSSLVLDSTGSSLFANCTDDNIYMFNVTGLKSDPVSVFNGHQNSTFYIKSSVSPDGQFLLSGSSNQSAYIWQVSDPMAPPTMLLGHSQEVTSVTWCPTDFSKIATCSDDNTVRIWRLKRSYDEDIEKDKTVLAGWTCQETHMAASYRTPAKAPRMQNNLFMLSPTPATCAPSYSGDLPMPSSTPTSVASMITKLQTPTRSKEEHKEASPKQLSSTKMSIKDWVTCTPQSRNSVMDSKTPSPRKAFTSVQQYPAVSSSRAPPLLENRVKRRLETSSEDVEHECSNNCNCVTELEPDFKKAKLDLCAVEKDVGNNDMCLSLADLSNKCKKQSIFFPKNISPLEVTETTQSLLGSPCELRTGCLDKENCSPEKNWLSALGNKLKCDKTSSQNKDNSPSRNGSAKKHQGKNVTSSPISVSRTPASMRKICTYFHKKPSE